MSDVPVGRHLVTLVLAALVFSGCLDDASEDGMEGQGDSPSGDAGPVDVFSPGWPNLGEAVVRPGVKIVADNGRLDCTANFLFSTPDNQTLYLGSASSCFIGVAIGDPVSIASGAVTGTLVYCSWGTLDRSNTCTDKQAIDQGWPNDFALVALPDEARHLVHPAILHWGGPTGMQESPPGPDVHVLTFRNNTNSDPDVEEPVSESANAREGLTTSPTVELIQWAEWITLARFAPPSILDDSGSPVILADGTALGLTVGFIAYEGATAVANLSPAMDYLHNHTDLKVELKNYHLLADPILPR